MSKKKEELVVEMMADKIKLYGPKVDGSFTITLEVGEYEQSKLAELVKIQQPTNFKVTIKEEKYV